MGALQNPLNSRALKSIHGKSVLMMQKCGVHQSGWLHIGPMLYQRWVSNPDDIPTWYQH